MGKYDTKNIKYCMKYPKCILCPKYNSCCKEKIDGKDYQYNHKRIQNKRTRL